MITLIYLVPCMVFIFQRVNNNYNTDSHDNSNGNSNSNKDDFEKQ